MLHDTDVITTGRSMLTEHELAWGRQTFRGNNVHDREKLTEREKFAREGFLTATTIEKIEKQCHERTNHDSSRNTNAGGAEQPAFRSDPARAS